MNSIDAMRMFVRVAEMASFTQAAEIMDLPKASLSTAVQRLETELGTRLLQRTTRRVQMTHDGELFYQRCLDVLADIDEMRTMFQSGDEQLSGRLRVDMSAGLARHLVMPNLPAFLQKHPQLHIEFSSTDRRVDLIREGFDCVIRVGAIGDGNLIARSLGEYVLVNCVSRRYAEQHGVPQTLHDLATHQLVHYSPVLGSRPLGFEYVDDNGDTQFVAMTGAITVNNSDAYLAACYAGFGIIQVPLVAVFDALRSGELIDVLPQQRAAAMPISLLYPHRRHVPKRVRVFMDWVQELLQKQLQSLTP